MLLLISSYRMFDTESTETIPYCLEPMDDNPGHESASASSHMGTPGSVRSRSHFPANHKRRRRWRQRARKAYWKGAW